MKADALTPRQLFDGNVHYEVPAFQRPYVWNEEDQWAPLWADVARVAEAILVDGEAEDHHFLGAVVYESKPHTVGDVARHSIIDGQQRTTTLQVLLDATQEVLETRGHQFLAADLERLILNRSAAFAGRPERFKLWPSRRDRQAFEHAMDPVSEWTAGEDRIIGAHRFFGSEVTAWLEQTEDDSPLVGYPEEQRVAALCETLQNRLYVVAINLTGHDDAQLIFETLNDRGTPLLKADLIKNWVFQRGDRLGVDVDAWAATQWGDFDDDWWRTEISQGRLYRSRIDVFLQYWLTMRTSKEVRAEDAFRTFADHAAPLMGTAEAADSFLGAMRRDADTYRNLIDLTADSVAGQFYYRVIETMGLAATSPVLLWLLSDNHNVPVEQRNLGLRALESWVVRRTLIRGSVKDVNRLMVTVLRELDKVPVATAGDTLVEVLASQTAPTRSWPTDAEMLKIVPTNRLYGYIRQSRIRVILEAIEYHVRTSRHEQITLQSDLEIEHVMP